MQIKRSSLRLNPILETSELINDFFGLEKFSDKVKFGKSIKNFSKFLEIKKQRLITDQLEIYSNKHKSGKKQPNDNLSGQLKMLEVFSKKILNYN